MEHWHGFQAARNVAQIYETTISDTATDLSAHFVTVPARSLGGESYLFRGSQWALETLGLMRIADVPFGGVARSLAACFVSDDVEEFLRKFDQGFEEETEHSSVRLPKPFVFAEYLTFARVIPFEQPSLSADSLGNILTAQGHGEAGYVHHEATGTPLLAVAIPAGVVICGSASGMVRALESGLRQRLTEIICPLRDPPLVLLGQLPLPRFSMAAIPWRHSFRRTAGARHRWRTGRGGMYPRVGTTTVRRRSGIRCVFRPTS